MMKNLALNACLAFSLLITPLLVSANTKTTYIYPNISRDGQAVILAGGSNGCIQNFTDIDVIKKSNGQKIGTLSNSTPQISLKNLSNGTHEYTGKVCWQGGQHHSGGCRTFPMVVHVDRSAPAYIENNMYIEPTDSPFNYTMNWQRDLYNAYKGHVDTTLTFTRSGSSKVHEFYSHKHQCKRVLSAPLKELIPGRYQVKLKICGEKVKGGKKTCSSAITKSLTVAGDPAEIVPAPIAIPSHKNNIAVPHSNSTRSTRLTAKTPGALSVDSGTASYAVPIKLPPGAAAIMPGLTLEYRNFRQTREKPLVNAGRDWIVTGFSTVPRCAEGTYEDCSRVNKHRESFTKFKRLYSRWFQPHQVNKVIAPDGTHYWYGDNSNGQGSKAAQLTRMHDVYGNSATLHYRTDGQLGFIHFSTDEAIIFNYNTKAILTSITTAINASRANPSTGQWVSRYELKHKKSATSDSQLVSEVRECGFNTSRQKSCATPTVFDYTRGQLGYESGETDDWDGVSYPSDAPYVPKRIRSKAGSFTVNEMKIRRNGENDVVLDLFDHSSFIKEGTKTTTVHGAEKKLRPVVYTHIADFNGDGLDDIQYGGAKWIQKNSTTLAFEWNGISPKYDIEAGKFTPFTGKTNCVMPIRESLREEVTECYFWPRDINGDGFSDRIGEFDFDIGIQSIDYNKDGRTDAFYIKDGEFVVDYSIKQGNKYVREGKPKRAFAGTLGDDWASRKDAASEIKQGQLPQIFIRDVTADGVPDALLARSGVLLAGLRGQPDLLSSITNGFGAKTLIDYDTLHSDEINGRPFYTQNDKELPVPNKWASRSMNVVKRLRYSNGIGGYTTNRFYYEGGWYNYDARMFVGFEKISQIQEDNGVVTDTYYNLEMPFHGTVAKTETKTTNGKWIGRATHHYVKHPKNNRYIYNDYSITEDFKLQPSPLSVTKTVNTYDQYGSLLTSDVHTGSGRSDNNVTDILGRTLTRYTPEHDINNWLLGFTKETTVFAYKGTYDDRRTYTHRYEREPNTLDIQEATMYAGSSIEQTTTYIRDERGSALPGVVTETIMNARDDTDAASAQRGATLDEFEKGLFPTKSYNALNHLTTLGYDHRFGKVNYTQDPNGLESTIIYDALGRDIEQISPTGAKTTLYSYFCGQSGSPYSCPANAKYYSYSKTTHPDEGTRTAAPITVTYYDSLERTIRTQTQSMNGAWVKQDTFYDELGRVEQVSEPFTGSAPSAFTSYSDFNALGEAQITTYADGSTASFTRIKLNDVEYIGTNRTLVGSRSVSSNLGDGTQINALGQVVFKVENGGSRIHYQYDSQGNLTQTQVENNEDTIVQIEHDIAGNKISIDDPAAGRIDYVYNGFGELRKQFWEKDTSNEKSMQFDFDVLGRQVIRTDIDASGNSLNHKWFYDISLLGMLNHTLHGTGGFRIYQYDELSRPIWMAESHDAGNQIFKYTYDKFGRPETTTYPTELTIEQHYTNNGILYKTADISTSAKSTLWELHSEIDSRGNYRYTKLGNNIVTQKTFDPLTGQLKEIVSGKVSSGFTSVKGTLQKLNYEWDSVGNLQQRKSQRVNSSGSRIENIIENFEYDRQNRLQLAETLGSSVTPRTLDYDYDKLGNLIHNGRSKLDYNQVNGASVYGITRGNGKNYHYDAYGNVIRRGTETNEYNVFNKPTRLGNTQFIYGSSHEKLSQTTKDKTTYFHAGGAVEIERESDSTIYTIRIGNYVHKKNGSVLTHEYHLKDHLGSTDVITDHNGNQITRMAFDAFGNKLKSHFASSNSTSKNATSYDGYTGHDQLDHLGLIHMGGRVYDPSVGRFLSADIFVQSPYNSQSYNRYSYVFNNPLSLTDPSGYAASCHGGEECADKRAPEEVIVRGFQDQARAARRAQAAANARAFSFRTVHSFYSSSYYGAIGGSSSRQTFYTGMISFYHGKAAHYTNLYNRILAGDRSAAADAIDLFIADNGGGTSISGQGGAWDIAGAIYDGAKGVAAVADPSVAAAEIGAVTAITRRVANSSVNGRADIRANKWTPFPVANALATSKTIQALRTAGGGLFLFTSGVSLVNGAQAFARGDNFGVGKSAVDLSFGAAGFFGGAFGAVGAISYGGTSAALNYIPGAYDSVVTPLVNAACSSTGNC